MCNTECACCGGETTDAVILSTEGLLQGTHIFIPSRNDNSTFYACKFSPDGIAKICVDCATTLLNKENEKD